jgi:hypothetical protein
MSNASFCIPPARKGDKTTLQDWQSRQSGQWDAIRFFLSESDISTELVLITGSLIPADGHGLLEPKDQVSYSAIPLYTIVSYYTRNQQIL